MNNQLVNTLEMPMVDSHPEVGAPVGRKSYLTFYSPFLLLTTEGRPQVLVKTARHHFLIQKTFLPPRVGKAPDTQRYCS